MLLQLELSNKYEVRKEHYIYKSIKAAKKSGLALFLFICLTFIFNPLNSRADRSVKVLKPTTDSIINLGSPDIKLLQQAILVSINNFRIENNVDALVWSDTLYKSAAFHLSSMNTRKFFDHCDPDDKAYPDLLKRVRSCSGQYSCLSENLIQYFPFKFKGKRIEYSIKKAKTKYQYLDPVTLKPLQVLTYGQLADQIVKQWAASPPHKINMLNAKNYRVGIAVNFPKYFTEPNISPVTVVSNFGSCN